MRLPRLAVLMPLLVLAACGSQDDTGPGGISTDEARELNDAAAMLDPNAVDADALAAPRR